jgi:hypothetical protein
MSFQFIIFQFFGFQLEEPHGNGQYERIVGEWWGRLDQYPERSHLIVQHSAQ